jgi:hypothetical protein
MSFGTKLFNSTGKLAFSTDYKTYVYQQKIYPIFFNNDSADYCTSPGLTGPIFPFVQTPDNTAVFVVINKPNPLGTTCAYSTQAQTSSAIVTANDDTYNVAWPRVTVGSTIKTPGGQTATVLSMVPGSLGTTTLNLSQAVTLAQLARIYVVEYIDSYYIKTLLNYPSGTASSLPMRIFSRNIPNTSTGYGAKMFDTSGACVFNSNYPVLTLAATAIMPSGSASIPWTPGSTASQITMSSVPVSAGSIPTDYSVFSPPLGNSAFTNYYGTGSSSGRIAGIGPTRLSSTTIQPTQCGVYNSGYVSGYSWSFYQSANIMFIDNAKYP